MAEINDGLVNVVANLGTGRDKSASSHYVYSPLNFIELLNAYRGAWLPRAIVDIPAQDATRKWRSWQAEADQIEKLDALENRLRVRAKIEECKIAARLYGGAALYISTGDSNSAAPLDPRRVRDIKSLVVLTPQGLTPGEIVKDIDSPLYGKPDRYRITSGVNATETWIHASRLVVMEGAHVPGVVHDGQRWGDSVLQSVYDAISQMDSTSANIASLIFEAKVDVFKFEGFAQLLQRAGGDQLAINRLSAQAAMKGINGAVVIDAADDYQAKSASFSGLDALMDRFANMVAGASRIPVTRLFGRASVGLSGTGDGDERTYFDRINHMQTTELEPSMAILDECIIWAALGSRPSDVWFRWNPLRQVTETERANIFKTTADAARSLAGAAAGELIPLDALSDSLVNELVEQGVLPGLDVKIEEYGTLSEQSLGEEEFVEPLPEVAPTVPIVANANDAAPRTLYVRRDVLNAKEIIKWAKAQGFDTTLPADDMHVTIAYSRTAVDWMKVGETWQSKMEIAEGGPRLIEKFGEAKVLLFRASELEWRHEAIKTAGATWDHPEYQPHVTISYGDMPENVQPYQGKIILGPERFEEIKEDWQSEIAEK